jgi:hypothetical protein
VIVSTFYSKLLCLGIPGTFLFEGLYVVLFI